jgi:signal transduction histidine kinase
MFTNARLKLTAWYLLIIMFISISFSAVIYKLLSNEVERFERAQRFRIERSLPYPPPFPTANPELLEETRHRIFSMLFFINLGILFISGGLGYILAGRTLTPIKEMVDEQNRFISDASHEFRTPLTSLKSAFEVYLRNNRSTLPEAKTLVRESVSEVDKLQALSDSLLQLTQYEKPEGNILLKKISLNKVIKDAVYRLRTIAKDKNISIKYSPVTLETMGNYYSLSELMVILLDNAIKYSSQNSRVELEVKKTDGSVLISVKDKGVGIDKKDIPHIFDRFYRTDSARTKQTIGGYGLGLSIAKKIVTMHKGTIRVKSTPKKGTTFTVKLPVFS